MASPIPQDDADKLAAGRKLWSEAFGVVDLASVREVRFDPSLPFSEALLITQTERQVAKDYELIYRDLSQFIDTLFASEAAEQAAQDERPDIFERDPSDPRLSKDSRAAQGKRFEDRVADLLRLLGYSVEREQLTGPDRVDLIASIESGLDKLTYFVECKDHKKAVSKEVVDLLGLWLTKPSAQTLHARGMVVANAFAPAALASAKALGITTTTPQDLERRLLDFDKYLFQLVADFEQTPLAASYVTQRSKPEGGRMLGSALTVTLGGDQAGVLSHIENLIDHGVAWAHGRDSRLWVLLGDYGTGKTAFTEKLAYELAKRARDDGAAPVPLRISLRDFPNKVKLEDLLAERWLQATGQRKDPGVLLHLIRRGRIVLLFDAFDEMGIAAAGRSVVEQFRMLVGITANPGDNATGNRVLITCREQFFKDHGDALKAATGEQDRIATSPLQDVAQRFDGAIHTVATFTPEQVKQFLVQRLGKTKGEEALKFLSDQRMMELGDRPQLLDIIVSSLPALEERQARSGEILSTGALYQTYTNKWLDDFKPAERQSSSAMLRSVLEELALLLWQRVGNRIHYGDLFNMLKLRADLRGQLDPNQLDVELRTAAFLSRTPDGLYGFSHRSFLEYFLARRIERSLCGADPQEAVEALNVPRLSSETCSFLHDLVPISDATRRVALKKAVKNILTPSEETAPAASRVNALLVGHGMSLLQSKDMATVRPAMKEWIPEEADFAGLDLSEMSLIFLVATGANLRNSNLKRSNLSQAHLRGAQLEHADLRHAWLDGADLSDANLQEADASDCSANHVVLINADASRSIWLNADLQNARVHLADFSNADLRAARLRETDGAPKLEEARTQGLTARNVSDWPLKMQTLTTPPLQRLLLAPDAAYSGAVNKVAFSQNGLQVIGGSDEGSIHVWDTKSGQLVRAMEEHKDGSLSMALSSDGRCIAKGSFDGTLRVWDVANGKLKPVMSNHGAGVLSVALSHAGHQIASGGVDKMLRLWDAASGQLLRVMEGHKDWVRSVAFNPRGSQIVSSGDDGALWLWDTASGKPMHVMEAHKGAVYSLAFSPDGTQIASGGEDCTFRLWDAASGNLVRVTEAHKDAVQSVVFSADGRSIASGGSDETLRVWDAASGQALRVIEGQRGGVVLSVAFSPDGCQIASGGSDGTLRLWDTASGESLRVMGEQQGDVLQSVAVSPDCSRIVGGGNNGTLHLWDATNGQLECVMDSYQPRVLSVAFSPDSRQVVGGGSDGTLCLWEISGGSGARVIEAHRNWVLSVAFSPDGIQIASGGVDGALRLWDNHSGKAVQVMEGHKDWVRSVAFSPNGRSIVSGGSDGTLRLWDTVSGRSLWVQADRGDPVLSVAFSPDGRQIISSGSIALTLWDADSGDPVRLMDGQIVGARSVAFSPDGQQIAAGDTDGTIRIWNAASGQQVRMIEGHKSAVLSIAYTTDGQQIASSSKDGTLRLWDAKGHELLRLRGGASSTRIYGNLNPKERRPPSSEAWNWVSLDFRTHPRGLWSGSGGLVDTVRYVDSAEEPEPWPWIPRYWRASDVPEFRAPTAPLVEDAGR